MDEETKGPTNGMLQQQIAQNFEACEGGHERLRKDLRMAETRIRNNEEALHLHIKRFEGIERQIDAGADASKVRFPLATVIVIATTIATVSAWGWSLKSGSHDETQAIRSEMRDVSTRVDAFTTDVQRALTAQAELAAAESKRRDERDAANARLADERSTTMSKAIQTIDAKQNMQDIKINSLRETVLTLSPRRE